MDQAMPPDRALDRGSGEGRLVAIGDLARRLAETHGVDETLQLAVELATAHLQGCDGGSVMLVRRGGRIAMPASTSETAAEIDRAQFEADEGPSLESLREHHTVAVQDLLTEKRWPHFRAAALGALMANEGLTAEAAFERLRDASQRHNRLLREVAEDVSRTGALPGS